MQIVKKVAGVAAMLAIILVGNGTERAAAVGNGSERILKPASPSVPRVICSISMQFWCIFQADATVNMADQGDYRLWTIIGAGSEVAGVFVRESKLCDSRANYRPKKVCEVDEDAPQGRRNHKVMFSLTDDSVCSLSIAYPMGSDALVARGGENS
jgi:hypothetical protein